mmetsp:Transcript_64121/g.151723  ORF Transcript_64121/g.151723 Transcript_64121/m.151723 type:complete len:234 (+) Transcript_64121:393-1094(+)
MARGYVDEVGGGGLWRGGKRGWCYHSWQRGGCVADRPPHPCSKVGDISPPRAHVVLLCDRTLVHRHELLSNGVVVFWHFESSRDGRESARRQQRFRSLRGLQLVEGDTNSLHQSQLELGENERRWLETRCRFPPRTPTLPYSSLEQNGDASDSEETFEELLGLCLIVRTRNLVDPVVPFPSQCGDEIDDLSSVAHDDEAEDEDVGKDNGEVDGATVLVDVGVVKAQGKKAEES